MRYEEENLSHCHFVQHKSHVDWPGIEPGPRFERPATTRLKQGTTFGAWNVPEIYLEFLTDSKHSVNTVRTNQLSLRSGVIGVYCEPLTKYVGTQCDKVQFV